MELIRRYKQGKLTSADVRTLNNTVICLMVLVAASSVIWSISIHILSGDFYNGIIGAKLVFRKRDFSQLDEGARELLLKDLGDIVNETYIEAALQNENERNRITTARRVMLEDERVLKTEASQTTKKPKERKLSHLFKTSSSLNVPDDYGDTESADEAEQEDINATAVPMVKFDAVADRTFLSSMTIDIHQTRWRESAAVHFVYNFPFLSEIIAIIWTAMCLIFQSGVKKYWGLPNPWRIVVPSITIFSLMSLGTLIYTILANRYITTFCSDLRANLTRPKAISCGDAMAVLRPIIRQHEFHHDVYLNLFRVSYMLTLVLWIFALLAMVLRYVFAVDFQLVDVQSPEEFNTEAELKFKGQELTEVLLTSTPHPQVQQQQETQPPSTLQVNERNKSEDDFQSAKSHQSEIATPLL